MSTRTKVGVTPATVRRLILALPGIEDGVSYGMPSFKLAGKFFARLRDDDTVLVLHLRSFEDRDGLLEHERSAFFTTEHYRNYPTMLVRLARVRQALLKEVLAECVATRRATQAAQGARRDLIRVSNREFTLERVN